MGLRSSPLKCPVPDRRLKVHGGWQIWLRLGLLGLGLLSSGGRPVAAISTTDAQVEATHTTLPVTLRLDDALSSAPPYVDLSEAETKDPQRLEIIKQIRKVNHDGSYTVGYEAEDGTFKIESRDVLGNVKGTYGYIDANGDIKRVSYGGDAGRPLAAHQPLRPAAVTPVPDQEEDIVHIPLRANRSQHLHQHQLLVPTTRRPSNYQPPTQQQHHLQQYTLQHGSTLRPSVIQTIPRKRPNYSTPSTTNSTAAVTTVAAVATSPMVAAPSTTEMPQTSPARGATTSTSTRVTTAAAAVGEVSEQSTASSTHTASTLLHTKPGGGGLLIIRPTPLPYQAAKPAEQLARPELRLESPPKFGHSTHPSKKTVRGNFFRRQLTSPAAVTGGESGEQYEAQAQQQQQITYADGSELYGGGGVGARSLYTTHPTTRIPAAVLAARQRAAHLQSVLQAQGERLPTTERVYVRQPPRAQPPTEPPSAAANRHAYEPSTESTSENSYVTDSPVHGQSVVQIPGAAHAAATAASEAEPEAEERHPVLFRPRPIDYRPPGLRYRTPYGLPSAASPPPPAPFARAELPYGRATGQEPPTDNDIGGGGGGRENGQPPYLGAYRQQRRLLLPAAEPDGYTQQQQQQQQQQHQQPQQQQQSTYPIPVPYGGGRLAPSPYYYDIPAERPLTARDFERILQVLIYRHQQLQQQQAAALRYGGYHPGGFGGRGYNPHNPYFLEPSVPPYGLPGGGYPQQQIPRPPLPFPYGGHLGQYDGYQNLLYSPSAGAGVRSDGSSDASGYGGRDGLGSAIRRQGQGYYPSQEPLGGRGGGADYLPPEVRESLLYRMLMLAMQAPGSSGEVLPLAAAAAASLTGGGGGGYPLQGAPSMTTVRAQTPPPRGELGGSATTMSSLYSKKPVRSVQILGEE